MRLDVHLFQPKLRDLQIFKDSSEGILSKKLRNENLVAADCSQNASTDVPSTVYQRAEIIYAALRLPVAYMMNPLVAIVTDVQQLNLLNDALPK